MASNIAFTVFPNTTRIPFDDVWKWSQEQIVDFLTDLANVKGERAASLVDTAVASVTDVQIAAGKIVHMLNTPGTTSVSPGDLDQRLTFLFLGQHLPFLTVYDHLGFILSATGTLPAGVESPNYNYFLPILSLYAKWCSWLAAECMESGQQMQHISYFPGANNQSRILLGSSIGSKLGEVRQKVLKNRIDSMTQLKLTRPRTDEVEPKSNYGVCGETMLYIYYKPAGLGINGARGFALNTNEKDWPEILKDKGYNEKVMAKFLRPPCRQSCRDLMAQVHLDPDTCFSIEDINET